MYRFLLFNIPVYFTCITLIRGWNISIPHRVMQRKCPFEVNNHTHTVHDRDQDEVEYIDHYDF